MNNSNNNFTPSKKLSELKISGIRQMNKLVGPKTINLGLGQMMDFATPDVLVTAGIETFKIKTLDIQKTRVYYH